MTRTKVGLAAALLILVTACTSTDQTTSPSTTPMLPPAGSIDPDYSAMISSQQAAASASSAGSSSAYSSKQTSAPSTTAVDGATASAPTMPPTTAPPSYDFATGRDAYSVSVSAAIDPSSQPAADEAVRLVRDALVLNDLLNQNPQDSELPGGLPDFYFGQILLDRQQGVDQTRANGRVQTGWTSGTLTATEFTNGTTVVEGCISSAGMELFDSSGLKIDFTTSTLYVMAGTATYDPGLRIGHLEFRPPADTICAP